MHAPGSLSTSAYHIFLIHSSVNGHLGCFHHVLVIVNSAAVNIGVHESFSFFFCLFRATPRAFGCSQARDGIGAVVILPFPSRRSGQARVAHQSFAGHAHMCCWVAPGSAHWGGRQLGQLLLYGLILIGTISLIIPSVDSYLNFLLLL